MPLVAKADDSSSSKRRLFPGKRRLFEQIREDLVEGIVRRYKEAGRPAKYWCSRSSSEMKVLKYRICEIRTLSARQIRKQPGLGTL